MKNDEVKLLIKHSDQYIAYIGKLLNIIASGKTIKEVEGKLRRKKITCATIEYIPPVNKSFSPYANS